MSLKKKAVVGLVWTYTQQFGNQIIGFIVSLVLARVLLPEEFGLVGMVAVVIAIANALVEGGLTKSLIRCTNCDDRDFSTVFFFNLGASLLIYLGIFFIAPLVADFYDREILTPIIRIYSLTVITGSLSAVQLARLTRNMNFKKQAFIAIPASVAGGAVGIWMAYHQYGVWSLVWSSIITSLLSTILFWFSSSWRPTLTFDRSRFKKHFNYGYKLTLSDLLNRLFNNLYLIVIGKYFSAAQVGFYTRAETMKQLPVNNITNALNKVTFPLFVSVQDDLERLRSIYKRLMLMVVFIVTPVLVLLGVLAEPTFIFLFTEKWLPAVPYFQILCVTGILYPLHSYNLTILNVKGRSDLFLKLEVIKKILIILAVLITLPFGIIALLYGQVIVSIIAFFINAHFTNEFITYSGWRQLKDIIPIFLISIVSGAAVMSVDFYLESSFSNFSRLLTGACLGSIVYLFLAYLFNFSSLSQVFELIRRK